MMMHGTITSSGSLAQRPSTGFTLIEVLVALIVTSIGLLGLAALQANGLRDNHGAYLRTQASYIASDIAERMRANLGATVAGNYEVDATAPTAPTFNCIGTFTGTAIAGQCTPDELAQADLFSWYSNLAGRTGTQPVAAMLPAGDAEIECSDDPCIRGSVHTITVRWDGNRSGATGRTCPPEADDDLFCIQIAFQP